MCVLKAAEEAWFALLQGKMFKWRLIHISACSVLVKLKQFIFLLLTMPLALIAVM